MSRTADPRVAQLWKCRIEQFQRSRSTVIEFCQNEGVSTAAFYHWKRRLQPAQTKSSTGQQIGQPQANSTSPMADSGQPNGTSNGSLFVPVKIARHEANAPPQAIQFQLPNGVLVQLPPDADEATIRRSVQLAEGLVRVNRQDGKEQ